MSIVLSSAGSIGVYRVSLSAISAFELRRALFKALVRGEDAFAPRPKRMLAFVYLDV
ncbi:Hypothetical protein FKW44_020986 [Caligus rogercresseyi]|uniref:Uncharacterized protein n=1 Tax=Caligus rogercresseyi TaxID=217165 RepID=A0A7T8GQU1_CALRO|nr:Hypothetical protein FKW44_020986 [Caligus rogercresseyi]